MSHSENTHPESSDSGLNCDPATTTDPCQVCHKALNVGAKFCPQCGRKLIPDKSSNEADSDPRPAESDQSSNQLTVGETADQEESTEVSIQCPCGRQLPAGAQYCHSCGTPTNCSKSSYKLVSMDHRRQVQIAELTDGAFIIGKSTDCSLVITGDDYVSRQHARLLDTGNSVILEDLKSANGTFLKVQGRIALKNGDEFLLGTHLIRFEHVKGS